MAAALDEISTYSDFGADYRPRTFGTRSIDVCWIYGTLNDIQQPQVLPRQADCGHKVPMAEVLTWLDREGQLWATFALSV